MMKSMEFVQCHQAMTRALTRLERYKVLCIRVVQDDFVFRIMSIENLKTTRLAKLQFIVPPFCSHCLVSPLFR